MEYFCKEDSNMDFMVRTKINENEQREKNVTQQPTEPTGPVITPFDHQVACMQFINIVVHSVENMNFRVYLQYEFTHQGLDEYLEVGLTFDPVIT